MEIKRYLESPTIMVSPVRAATYIEAHSGGYTVSIELMGGLRMVKLHIPRLMVLMHAKPISFPDMVIYINIYIYVWFACMWLFCLFY